MKSFLLALSLLAVSIAAHAATLQCEMKYTWPKGSNELNYDLDQKVSVKLKKMAGAGGLAADADLKTLDGRYEVHMTAMSPDTAKKSMLGAAFIRLGVMDKVSDTYSSGNEVFVQAGKKPFNRAHLHIVPDFKRDESRPAHGLSIDCELN